MSDRLPSFSSIQLIRALLRLGFLMKPGGKGSHVKLVHPQYPGAITVPKRAALGKGIRAAMVKQFEAMGVDRTGLLNSL